MDEDSYYIVTEGGAPAVEEVPAVGGKAAVVCGQPDLAGEGEMLEPITSEDLALLLEARADIGYVRIRGPKDRGQSRSPNSQETRITDPPAGAPTTRAEGLTAYYHVWSPPAGSLGRV